MIKAITAIKIINQINKIASGDNQINTSVKRPNNQNNKISQVTIRADLFLFLVIFLTTKKIIIEDIIDISNGFIR